MCKIGITYNPSIDLFYSGLNQTSLLFTELLADHELYLIDISSNDTNWWADYPQNKKLQFVQLHQISDLDLLIDMDGLLLPEYRIRIAKRSVVFLRSFLQFSELDNAVYPEKKYTPRDYNGVYEIWCWDILNPIETLDSVQTLFPCPIKTVPFIWSPTVAEYYGTNISDNVSHMECHIAEKSDDTSSAIIPLVAIRELCLHVNYKYIVHNIKKDNRFLKENILDNIEMSNLPVTCKDKEPYYKWTNSILFSHSRFVPIRIGLLNAIWLGIPLIHNSPILKSIPVLDTLFYFGNNIKDICKAFKTVDHNHFQESLNDIKKCILDKWSIKTHLATWKNIIHSTVDSIVVNEVDNEIDNTVVNEVDNTVVNEVDNTLHNTSLLIGFSDMWPGFNYDNNFIIDSLRHNSKHIIKGIEYNHCDINLLIFGPYSQTWKSAPSSIPKIYISCENPDIWKTPTDDSIQLFLTSSLIEDDKHLHLPTWMTFIDWFSGSTTLPTIEDNPIRIPLHFATNPHPIPFNQRDKFCGFVVSNPTCTFRNETFNAVNAYKPVNSGGLLYNNIGGQLTLKYPGGGAGDISKYKFFEEHKFTISFENSQSPGYITEKVLHSKMAGCIPIYWGTCDDFVPGSIVNLSHLSEPSKIVEIIQKLEENPNLCNKIASMPLLDENRTEKALQIITNISNKILEVTCIPAIDKVFLINLDTRPDRWKSFKEEEPFLKIHRVSAVNGKTLKMDKMIYDLFKHNTFNWKKSAIGCNLSHISIWKSIINEPGTHFLILEDDVRFKKGWKKEWSQYAQHIPDDADILYVGGVLPPNKQVLPLCLEKVNEYWSQITPNTYFSSTPMPIFHFCTYSYIISKKGAQKMLQFLYESEKKSYAVVDHLLGSPLVNLTKYVANSLLCHCFQDNDPVYLNSQFNDLHRKDKFDSDIWNNTECFEPEAIKEVMKDALDIYHIGEFIPYEQSWLNEIFGAITFKPFNEVNNSWFVVQRPHVETYNNHFRVLNSKNINFKVLHLSDEFGIDDISFYKLPACELVIRNYIRPDTNLSNVITIPLGFHYKSTSNKTFSDRKLAWSFHGTEWFNRKDKLEMLSEFLPYNCHLTPEWNHSSMTKEEKYISTLNDSKFCPVLRGNNFETFRMYECLEAGSIPI
jgi:GR25 family glycosyltransferase involved in LPS biosynthesis